MIKKCVNVQGLVIKALLMTVGYKMRDDELRFLLSLSRLKCIQNCQGNRGDFEGHCGRSLIVTCTSITFKIPVGCRQCCRAALFSWSLSRKVPEALAPSFQLEPE